MSDIPGPTQVAPWPGPPPPNWPAWPPAPLPARPPRPPRPPEPPLPRRLPAAVLAAGIVAAAAMPLSPPGLGLLVGTLAISGAVLVAARTRLRPWPVTFGALAVALVALTAVRAAPWVAVIDLLAALALASFAVSDAAGWLGLLRGLISVPAASIRVPRWLASSPRGVSGVGSAAGRSVLRGVALASGLLMVFGLLFGWADAVFADLVGRALPRLDGALAARFPVGLAAAGFASAAALVAARPAATSARTAGTATAATVTEAGARRERRRVEWMLPLAALDLLFAAFVAVQLTVLFGGHAHVLSTTGLSYAQYARQGFWQLLVVGALTLVVIAAAVRLVRQDRPADRAVLRVLLGLLCLLTLVVLASAVRRMDLYEQAYGLTRLRVSVEATLYWLAAIFALVLVAGAFRRSPWLPRAAVALTGLALVTFALSDPDARIAASAVHVAQRGSPIDAAYLSTLSADAVPALQSLPEGQGDPLTRASRGCALATVARRVHGPSGWADWNLGLDRARRILAANPLPPGADYCRARRDLLRR